LVCRQGKLVLVAVGKLGYVLVGRHGGARSVWVRQGEVGCGEIERRPLNRGLRFIVSIARYAFPSSSSTLCIRMRLNPVHHPIPSTQQSSL